MVRREGEMREGAQALRERLGRARTREYGV